MPVIYFGNYVIFFRNTYWSYLDLLLFAVILYLFSRYNRYMYSSPSFIWQYRLLLYIKYIISDILGYYVISTWGGLA